MAKKIISLAMVIGLILGCTAFASADTAIVNSMDFQGQKVELTLDKAIEIAKTNSLAGKTAEWNKSLANTYYDENYDNAKNVNKAFKAGSTTYTSKDAGILRFMGEFAVVQKNKNYTAELNILRADVIKQYFQIKNLEDLVKINTDNVTTREKLYNNTNKKFELGMVAKQDVLSSEYELNSAKTTLNESISNLKSAKMAFNVLLDYDVMQNVVLTDTAVENTTTSALSISDAVSAALINRNEIYATKYGVDLQNLVMEKIKIRYSASTYVYRQQQIAVEQAQEQYDYYKKMVETDVRTKYLDMNQKKSAIETDKKALETATEALRLTQLSYDAGMAIITDVQTVQTKVFQAKLALSNAILEYNLAVDAFSESMGNGRYVVSLMGASE